MFEETAIQNVTTIKLNGVFSVDKKKQIGWEKSERVVAVYEDCTYLPTTNYCHIKIIVVSLGGNLEMQFQTHVIH